MSDGAKTLKELASRLEVSITTVSRALAGDRAIALKTRERVAEAARQLGYVPNTAARALVSGRSNFVGLVLPIRGPNLVDSFLGEFVTGLGEGLQSRGVDLGRVAITPAVMTAIRSRQAPRRKLASSSQRVKKPSEDRAIPAPTTAPSAARPAPIASFFQAGWGSSVSVPIRQSPSR